MSQIKIMARFLLYVMGAWLVWPLSAHAQDGRVVKHFRETDEVFNNPGKGFTTFQRFNGDTANVLTDCCGRFRDDYPFPINTRNSNGGRANEEYPETSIAYFRFYWRYLEPEEGEYRWNIIDRALKTAHERGQTLMLSVMPYGTEGDEASDVPEWYRDMVGERTDWLYDNPTNKWLVNPENPRYVEHYGGLIQALGERYDGHPDLHSVDARIVGAWGEGGGTEMLTEETTQALMDAYLESFKETPLLTMLHGKESVTYADSKTAVGWRQDCLGDLGFWAEEPGDWTHMYDYYPRVIIEYGMGDAWKNSPVSFEICGTFPTWKDREGYDLADVNYIFEQALKWHVSSVNGKSSAVPDEWMPAVNEFRKKMGYRFVLRRFTYPETVQPGGKLRFTSWWENKGVAPIYEKYPLVLRLRSSESSTMIRTGADVREWMPGDNLYDETVFIPRDLPAGEYQLELALVESVSDLDKSPQPAVELANEGRTDEGWYLIGEINVMNSLE